MSVLSGLLGILTLLSQIFLPDETNGMKIQAEYQAAVMKRTQEREKKQLDRIKRQNGRPQTPDMPDEIRIPDSTKLHCVSHKNYLKLPELRQLSNNNFLIDCCTGERGQCIRCVHQLCRGLQQLHIRPAR